MLRGRKRATPLQSVIDEVADPARELAASAAQAASRVATEAARRSTDLGSQVGEKVSEVAKNVSIDGRGSANEHSRRVRSGRRTLKQRVRRVAVLGAVGAAAAYFLDPQNGSERRTMARRRISNSAEVVGDGLERGARAAHQAADATATSALDLDATATAGPVL